MYELLQDKAAREFLTTSASIYERLTDRVLSLHRGGHGEQALKWIQLTANFAWLFHPARFADGKIENIALEIGRELESPQQRSADISTNESDHSDQRRVLHVATGISGIGGHTRLISNWMENDGASRHSLLLVSQRDPVPEWVRLAAEASGGTITSLPNDLPLLEKAVRLRALARAQADIVVLHQHPDDVVPVVAFAAEGGPPVVIMNHADHVFWLGSSVADVVANVREFGKRLCEERRFARHSMLLPIPLGAVPPNAARSETRSRLGFGESEVVMLSVGSSYKYTPTKTHHFFRTVRKTLERNKRAHLYLVGVAESEDLKHVKEFRHERLHLLGVVPDPTPYYQAADLYLEGFPYGSMTALLEAIMTGVCPVLMYKPIPQADMSEDVGLQEIVKGAGSEQEYVEQVSALIADEDSRKKLSEQVAAKVISSHRGEIWREYLQRIYEQLESKTHESAMIPESVRSEDLDDLGLSAFALTRQKGPLLQTVVNQNFNRLAVGDIMWLLFLARTMRDGKFTYKENSIWGGLLKAKALKETGANY
ncbi:MAG: glycosyltransferase family 4 protein [Acidobacteriota bacterium]